MVKKSFGTLEWRNQLFIAIEYTVNYLIYKPPWLPSQEAKYHMKEVCFVHIYYIRRHSKETIWFQKTLLYQTLLFWTLLKTNVKYETFPLLLNNSVIVQMSHFIKFEISAQLSPTCDNTRESLEDLIMQHLWTELHLFYEKVWNHTLLIPHERL